MVTPNFAPYLATHTPARVVMMAVLNVYNSFLLAPDATRERWEIDPLAPEWIHILHQKQDMDDTLLWIYTALRMLYPNLILVAGGNRLVQRFILLDEDEVTPAGWQGRCLATGATVTITAALAGHPETPS